MQNSCLLICWFIFLICSCLTNCQHSKTIRTEKLSPLYQETKLGLISQWGVWIPYCSNPHFSQHDSDKQRLRGGLVKCQRMTMRLLKLQPAIWINVQKDSTCFHPLETKGCWGYSCQIDTSQTVICLSSAVKRWNACGCHDQQDTQCSPRSGVNTLAYDASWKHIRHSWVSLRAMAQRADRTPAEEKHQTTHWNENLSGTPFQGYVCMHSDQAGSVIIKARLLYLVNLIDFIY